MEDINADYGGLVYIERNNVAVTLSGMQDMNGITVSGDGGGIIDWICQSKKSEMDSDICGDLYILDSKFNLFESNIFTIDLSSDPSQVAFNLNVQHSSFMNNNNGSIFNFNHGNDELGPLQDRIQQRNLFVTIEYSNFTNNGRTKGTVYDTIYTDPLGWYQRPSTDTYTQNGTIFTINSATVPNITIQESNFIDNAGHHGAIFYWYCSRYVQLIEDQKCGQISLQNSIFRGNDIAQYTGLSPPITRFGSIIYALINQRQYFSLLVQGCNFIEQGGNMMYFQAVDPIDPCTPSNGTLLGNNTNADCLNLNLNSNLNSNNLNGTNSTLSSNEVSWIYIEQCSFTNNTDEQYANNRPAAILNVKGQQDIFITIDNSAFVGQRSHGAAILFMDYASLISITHSMFNDNAGWPGWGS